MSELYLVLRNRLPADMEWVQIGKPQLQKARKAKGLSYEGAARLLNISSQTVYRREKEGRWPAYEIEQLATVYGLEIERPAPQRVSLDGHGETSREESSSGVQEAIADLARAVEGLAAEQRRQADEIVELRQELAPTLRRAQEPGER